MKKSLLLPLALAFLGCAAHPHRPCPATLALSSPTSAESFARLREHGPVRFSQVDERLFRGGQPSRADLAELRALGVKTVISLRNEDPLATRAEAAAAAELGLRFLHFPFSAAFTVSPELVDRVMGAIAAPENGVVYVHCKVGRDRTSLMVALHLVRHRGWVPEQAWQRAALDYGHVPSFLYRKLAAAFARG
jgi:uncharacterized protein (TIGR01244 family)